ncbi:MAG: ATP-binding cassette domain-containing protein, partial [Ilumatobacter sp.]|nr:ATP-binding cassette domain-containing protein [Ilumatobacter sp.]
WDEVKDKLHEAGTHLSGGQQQMLALGMSFLLTPRLLMIDELSLGLAPVIVQQLLAMVRKIAERGVTIILVEQSVNVALELADTAYFMERGRIRFRGPTTELVERNDLLRSVFLGDTVASPIEPSAASIDGATPLPPNNHAANASMALSVRGLSRRFGGLTAVNQVDVDVAEREIVGFIGPNGAGKTTLFDLIGGTTPTNAGRIELAGHDLSSATASERARRGLGRSFQDAQLFPSLTVEETIAVALERWISSRSPISAALHLPTAFDSEADIRRRVAELVELMNLGPYRQKQIRELSTGSRRIVDLACIVAHRPTVVLLDEPSSGIAQREVEALGPVIDRMRTQMGSALLVIEHDMTLLSSVADRVVAMDQGSVISIGPPDDVLSDPAVVASYLGTDPTAIHRSNTLTTD